MTYKPGQIVEILVTFAEGGEAKRRPVIIVAEADPLGDLLGLPITGSGHHPHSVALQDADMARGSMKKASHIRVRKPLTFHSSAVGRAFGELHDGALSRIKSAMCHALCNCAPAE